MGFVVTSILGRQRITPARHPTVKRSAESHLRRVARFVDIVRLNKAMFQLSFGTRSFYPPQALLRAAY